MSSPAYSDLTDISSSSAPTAIGHSISVPSPPLSCAKGAARVHMIPAATDNISWLLEYERGRVALIDGPSMVPVIHYCETHALQITHILNTHIHGDHIGVNHGLESARLRSPEVFGAEIEVWGGALTADAIPHISRALEDGASLHLGGLRGVAWLTEGHLNGHISLCFWSEDSAGISTPQEGDEAALFCGDTLFAAGCGRLFDGPASAMYESLARLCALPEDTLVFPAHEYTLDNLKFARYASPERIAIQERLAACEVIRGEGRSTLPSTIALERQTNPFVLAPDVARFATLRAQKDRGAHRD